MEYEENDSAVLTCLQQTINNNNYTSQLLSPSIVTANTVLQFLYHIITIPLATVLNFLVILIIVKTKSLWTPTLFAALQIAFSDLVVAIVYGSTILSSVIGGGWVLGTYLCLITAVTIHVLLFVRIFLLAVLALDRFLFVFAPHSYPTMQRNVVLVLSVASWLVSTLATVLLLPGIFDCIGYIPLLALCHFTPSCNLTCPALIVVIFSVLVVPTCSLPGILYTCLYFKARRLSNSSASEQKRIKIGSKATVTFSFAFLSSILLTLPLSLLLVIVITATDSRAAQSIIFILCSFSFRLVFITDPVFILIYPKVNSAFVKLASTTSILCRSIGFRNCCNTLETGSSASR